MKQWSIMKGGKYPSTETGSTTIYRDAVYATVYHAFLSCVLWYAGGVTGVIEYDFYPLGKDVFPHLSLKNPHALGLPFDSTVDTIAMHYLPMEPTHGQLLKFGQQLRDAGYTGCVLLVGDILPRKHNPFNDPPPLRGIVLFADLLLSNSTDSDHNAFPVGSVVPGWIPCLGGDRMTLRFTMHGQTETRALPPVSLPPLVQYDLRVWKRADGCFCIAPKASILEEEKWNETINGFHQS